MGDERMVHHKGQGATEYLVLLAVVLIVALVSVALLGFFPSMASDAQVTQSKMYWQSASPIAIMEWGARYVNASEGYTQIYMRIRNTGSYSIRLSKILINGRNTTLLCTYPGWWCGGTSVGVMYLYPGEEKIFAHASYFPGTPQGSGATGDSGGDVGKFFIPENQMPGSMGANCTRDAPYGTAVMNSFGFEYIQYVDSQPIAKRQVGAKPIVIKCMNNYN
jgi:hypothetical protein